MRHLFFLVAMPLLFDACVAAGLGAGHPAPNPPAQTEAERGYVVFFDWDGVELSPSSRRTLAAAAHAASLHGHARVELLGDLDRAAGSAYTAALSMERARRVRSELLRDGATPTDISIVGPGIFQGEARRIQLVLQWTS